MRKKSCFWFCFCILSISLCISSLFADERFDPLQVAKEEAAAWRGYYNNDIAGLVQHLSHLVIIEFRLNQMTAWQTVIPELIAAAAIFKNLPEDTSQDTYNSKVLPHLENAYQSIHDALHAKWDPHQAAQDELDWWVYRHRQKTENPEIVGKKIEQLYLLIYGNHDQGHFARAGYLRAVAARYRDLVQAAAGHLEEADWGIIESILELSYKELLLGIQANAAKS